ncbi:hypothetical protein ScPMuIL_014655 [Solemya velum]
MRINQLKCEPEYRWCWILRSTTPIPGSATDSLSMGVLPAFCVIACAIIFLTGECSAVYQFAAVNTQRVTYASFPGYCASSSYYDAVLDTSTKMDEAKDYLTANTVFYIWLPLKYTNNAYYWFDGTVLGAYSSWLPGEPPADPVGVGKLCVLSAFSDGYLWKSHDCSAGAFVLCVTSIDTPSQLDSTTAMTTIDTTNALISTTATDPTTTTLPTTTEQTTTNPSTTTVPTTTEQTTTDPTTTILPTTTDPTTTTVPTTTEQTTTDPTTTTVPTTTTLPTTTEQTTTNPTTTTVPTTTDPTTTTLPTTTEQTTTNPTTTTVPPTTEQTTTDPTTTTVLTTTEQATTDSSTSTTDNGIYFNNGLNMALYNFKRIHKDAKLGESSQANGIQRSKLKCAAFCVAHQGCNSFSFSNSMQCAIYTEPSISLTNTQFEQGTSVWNRRV